MSERNQQFPCGLTPSERELWNSIAAFRFDCESGSKSFAARLASENGWTNKYTERVIDEYRRFLFLTSVAGHVVCPSEQVDAAWHQHLIYSRSYWKELCENILHHPLHHDPTMGGPDEKRKHWALYQQTLESYRRVFCEDPPQDIWPLPFDRFDPRSRHLSVDLRDHWVLRKPRWWPIRSGRRSKYAAFILPGAAIGWGPFDLNGPEFLLLYGCLVAVFLTASYIYRRMMRDVPVTDPRDLTPEEIACLKFGQAGAVNATLAGMVHDNELTTTASKGVLGFIAGSTVKFAPGSSAPPNNSSLESAIHAAVQTNERTLAEIHASTQLETAIIEDRLIELGYLLDAGQLSKARVLPFIAMLILLGVGALKIAIGISRGRPVEFLLIGCIAVFLTFLVVMFSFRRSIAGDQLLTSLADQYSDLRGQSQEAVRSRQNVLLTAALFGPLALENSRFDNLKAAWKSGGNGWSSGSGGYCCTGGGGGHAGCGGTGGCGGGGGGGCGGCGGGGS